MLCCQQHGPLPSWQLWRRTPRTKQIWLHRMGWMLLFRVVELKCVERSLELCPSGARKPTYAFVRNVDPPLCGNRSTKVSLTSLGATKHSLSTRLQGGRFSGDKDSLSLVVTPPLRLCGSSATQSNATFQRGTAKSSAALMAPHALRTAKTMYHKHYKK